MDLLKDLSIDKIRNAAEDALNQVKPKTDVEARVYEVLSHKNWGAASSIMNQIARDTWDFEKFTIITRIMWENVETQRPSAWRVIFKGLTLLEHLVKNGSERCVDDARNHGHVLRKLHQFNYYEGTIDRGLGVREKSKQVAEMLGDNERVREERQKAKKLREKFQGKSAAAGGGGGGYSGGDGWSSSGGGGGGGGWDGGGNDDWNSGGGGYASGGIDSGKNNMSSGARGRYDDDRGSSAAAAPAPGPTFAQLPPATTKQTATKAGKKVKKKKAPVSTPDSGAPAPGPEVDLFSFDDTSPAPTPAAADDDFSGFHSAGAGPSAASNDPFGGDPFVAGPTSAPTSTSSMGQPQPDPFAVHPQQPASMNNINAMNNMFGTMSMGGGAGGMNPMMGGMNPTTGTMNPMMGAVNPMMGNNMMGGVMMGTNNTVMGSRAANGMMGVVKPPAPSSSADFDDDFGDFEGASGGQSASTPVGPSKSSDPFGGLISLDGLSKNTKKEDKLNQPIVINAAAAQYMQDKQLGIGVAAPQDSAKSTAMSFAGIDGLQKSAPANSMGMGMGMGMGGGFGSMGMGGMSSPVAGGMNPNVMGSSGTGNASLIGALDPQLMTPQPARQQPQGMAGMTPQQQQMMQMMMMQNPQMMQQMMANGGQMTPQHQQQMMQMMMMTQQQMMGGGMGGGNNMMGGQGGQMGGQMGMGGQPMGGGGFGGF